MFVIFFIKLSFLVRFNSAHNKIFFIYLVSHQGVEPWAHGLKVRCKTILLHRVVEIIVKAYALDLGLALFLPGETRTIYAQSLLLYPTIGRSPQRGTTNRS